MNRCTWIVAILVSLGCWVGAANAFKIESTTAEPGEQDVLVRLLVDTDDPVLGLSVAGTYDDGLTFDRLSVDGTEFGPGDLDADFVQEIKWGDVFGAAIVIELPGSLQDPYNKLTLPAGSNHYVLALYFDVGAGVDAGTELAIDLRDDLESCDPTDAVNCNPDPPEVAPVFTVDGETVTPQLVDGTVTIEGPPTIDTVVPQFGPPAGGTNITITGGGFTADTTVTLGGTALANKVVVDANTITGTTPAHAAGWVDVVASNSLGSGTFPGKFIYGEAPTITGVSPNQGSGGVTVTVTGSGFTTDNDTVVLVNTFNPVTNLTVVSYTQLTCTLPACNSIPVQNDFLSMSVTTSFGTDSLDEAYCCGNCGGVEPIFVRGDANAADAKMDIADAVYILQNLFASGPAMPCMDAADSNDDENVDIADAVYILQRLFASGPAIPPPNPACGIDTTGKPGTGEQVLGCESYPALGLCP